MIPFKFQVLVASGNETPVGGCHFLTGQAKYFQLVSWLESSIMRIPTNFGKLVLVLQSVGIITALSFGPSVSI